MGNGPRESKTIRSESNLIDRNESNRPAKGVHTGGRAGGAARKEVTPQTHGHDKYRHTIVDATLLNLNRGRNTAWYLCELDCC